MAAGDINLGLSLADVDTVLAHIEREIAGKALTIEDAVTVIHKARLSIADTRVTIEANAILAAAAEREGGFGGDG